MKRHIIIYGLCGGLMIAALKWMEYRFLIVDHSIEIYGGLIAATFAGLGIWLGLKLTATTEKIVVKEVQVPVNRTSPGEFVLNQNKVDELGVTPRELEILGLMAKGMS